MTHDWRLVPAAAIGWAVTALAVQSVPRVSWGVLAISAVLAIGFHRYPRVLLVGVVVSAMSCGVGLRISQVAESPLASAAEQGQTVVMEVEPRRDARVVGRQDSGHGFVPVVVRRVELGPQNWQLRARATLFLTGELDRFVVGQPVVVRAKLSPSDKSDEAAIGRVSAVLQTGDPPWWWAVSERIRSGVRSAVAHYDEPAATLVPALVAGDESSIGASTAEDFRRSGLTHLLAVSGTNLTIVLGATLMLLRVIRWGRLRLWVAPVVIVAFVLVARPEPSVLRAAVMGVVAVIAMGVGTPGGTRALSIAVIALLLIDPWLSVAPGFILSVCATAGIVVLGPRFSEKLERWLPRSLAMACAIPLAAQIACTPAVAAISGEVSAVAVFANIVAAPAVAPATIAGLSAGLLALVWLPIAQLVGSVAVWSARAIVWTGEYSAAADGASWGWDLPWWTLIAAMAATIWVVERLLSRPVWVGATTAALCFVIISPPQFGWPPDNPVLVMCDVGQGDGLVLPMGDGQAVVIDAGEDATLINRCLRQLGIDRVNLLIFSHGDFDHVGGWRGVVRGRQVDAVLSGPGGGVEPPGVPVVATSAGQVFQVGEMTIEVLWPRATARPVVDRNDASLVLLIEHESLRILFTGDLGESAQRRIARLYPAMQVDVIKVPHHGSADHSPELFSQTGANIALISAGADNRHGHPAPSLLATLRAEGLDVWRTDLDGAVAIVLDEQEPRVVAEHR